MARTVLGQIMFVCCVLVGTVTSGTPSPYLDTRISFIAGLVGTFGGYMSSRYTETVSREGFLRETVLSDTILVWRAVAGAPNEQSGSGERDHRHRGRRHVE